MRKDEETRFKPGNTSGLATRFQPGTCANPGGHSALEREYRLYLDKLFEDGVKEKAWACLVKAIEKGEVWAVERYFNMVEKVLPQRPLELNIQADLTVGRKEIDEQLEWVTRELDRLAAAGRTTSNTGEDGSSATPVRLAILGPKDSA
jgi:hypothetical protein